MNEILQFVSPRYIGAVQKLILFLTASQGNGAVQTLINQLNSGDKVLKEGHHYFRKHIIKNAEPSGIIECIKGIDAKAVGVTSFDKAKLAQGEVFCVSHLGLSFAKNTGGANLAPEDLLYNNTIFNAKDYAAGTVDLNSTETGSQLMPVEAQLIANKFLSAEIAFKFGGERWLEGNFRDFCKLHKLNVAEGLGAFDACLIKELGIPKVLDSTKELGFNIEFPVNATAVGAADYYINIDMYGIRVTDKA